MVEAVTIGRHEARGVRREWSWPRRRLCARLACLMLLLGWVGTPSSACAHRDDEYLQATLVIIEPGEVRLRINLTPGIAVAEQVITRIDRDRDGAISEREAAAYAESLKRDLTLRLDRRKLELQITASEFVTPEELRSGSGLIQMEFSASFGPLAAGPHNLTLANRHMAKTSVYLINAAKPKLGTVQITSQKRNHNQSAGEIGFLFHPSSEIAEAGARP
jgi:hypothetical protein